MKKFRNIIGLILIFVFLACAVGCQDVGHGKSMVTGEGEITSKVFELDEVATVELTNIMRVNVTSDIEIRTEVHLAKGDKNSVTIETYENILENIDVTQKGANVTVSGNAKQKYKTDKIVLTLTLKNPEKIIFDGYYKITSSSDFSADELLLRLGKGANCDISFFGKALAFETAPNCTVTLWDGKTEDISVISEGGCALDFEYLSALTADISLKDADTCIVNASDKLKIAIDGAGALSYFGEPEIETNVSELASITQAIPYQDE